MKKNFNFILTVLATVAFCANTSFAMGPNGVGTSKSFNGPVGLQLYSLRTIFATNADAGLKATKNMGFVEIEVSGTYNMTPEKYVETLKAAGLKPVSGLWDYNEFAKNLDGMVRLAKALGVKYAGTAYIPHEGAFSEKACREAAAVFNKAGEALAKEGITFVFHNHGYEFVPFGDGTLFDLLVKETKPEFVSFEMDTMWVVFPGQDPVALLKKYPGRWALMHVKDLRKGVQTGSLKGWTEETNDVSIGTGQINFPVLMRAAQEVGVKHYFIEDESPAPCQQIPNSLKYLESLSW